MKYLWLYFWHLKLEISLGHHIWKEQEGKLWIFAFVVLSRRKSEYSILLGYDTRSLGKWFLTLERNVVPVKWWRPIIWWCGISSQKHQVLYCTTMKTSRRTSEILWIFCRTCCQAAVCEWKGWWEVILSLVALKVLTLPSVPLRKLTVWLTGKVF